MPTIPTEDRNQKICRVRFDSVDDNGGCQDLGRGRSKDKNGDDTFRKRSQSHPGFGSTEFDFRDLYKVVHVDQTGGMLTSLIFQNRRTVLFDVKYTMFCGASFNVPEVSELIYPGDIVIVTQKCPYRSIAGFNEWHAMDIRYPNPTDPEQFQRNTNDSGDPVWVVHGRILSSTLHSKTRQDVVISTGKDLHVFAPKESCWGDLSKYEKDVTVLVRAEKRRGAKQQAANFPWYGVKVEIVGVIKDGQGFVKQQRFGHKPFYVIAPGFGYVLIPAESQRVCRKSLADGAKASFKACSNLPCQKSGLKPLYHWRAIEIVCEVEKPAVENGEIETREVQVLPPPPPSNATVATCFTMCTCQGQLVCLCYS